MVSPNNEGSTMPPIDEVSKELGELSSGQEFLKSEVGDIKSGLAELTKSVNEIKMERKGESGALKGVKAFAMFVVGCISVASLIIGIVNKTSCEEGKNEDTSNSKP